MKVAPTIAGWFAAILLLSNLATAAKEPPKVLLWPSDEKPAMRFTFGKFVKTGTIGGETGYTVEVTADNLSQKAIPNAMFEVYFLSKENVRIGAGHISLNNLGATESMKTAVHFSTTGGQPAMLRLVPTHLPKELGGAAAPAKVVGMTVYSVPPGALLKVDGAEVGVTPKQVRLGVGKHALEFSKEGYNTGKFPIEIGPDDVSGGNINFELGALAHDTIEMRDGSTLTGDVETVSATTVEIRIAGDVQSFERNKVKRILFVEREAPAATDLQPAK